VVPASGNIQVAARQFWLGPTRAGDGVGSITGSGLDSLAGWDHP